MTTSKQYAFGHPMKIDYADHCHSRNTLTHAHTRLLAAGKFSKTSLCLGKLNHLFLIVLKTDLNGTRQDFTKIQCSLCRQQKLFHFPVPLPFIDYVWCTTASVDCTFDIGDLTEPAAFPDKKGSPWKTNNPTKSIIT